MADRLSDWGVDVVCEKGTSDFFRLIHVPDLAGTFMADHAGTDRGSRVADFPKELAVGRLGNPPENLVADTGRMFADMPEHNSELFLGIVAVQTPFSAVNPEPRDDRETTPFDIGWFKDLIHHFFGLEIPFTADCTGVGIVYPVRSFLHLLHQHEKTQQDIFCFEPSNNLGDRELFVFFVPHHRADMAGEHETVQFCFALFEQPFHRRRNDAVTGKYGEILWRFCEKGCSNGRCGGLKPDRDEDNFLIGLPRDFHGLVDSLYNPYITSARFQGSFGSRDTEKIAIGCDDTILFRQDRARHQSHPGA